jgi:hypothetical protein
MDPATHFTGQVIRRDDFVAWFRRELAEVQLLTQLPQRS